MLFASLVTDGFGRRAGMACGGLLCCLGAALQASTMNLTWFCMARGLLGAGATINAASSAALVIESAHPAHRATFSAIFLTSFSLGGVVAAWTTFGTYVYEGSASWRIPSSIQAVPSVLQLLGLYWLPESPRWLLSKNKEEAALRMLSKYHAEGNVNDPVVQFEYDTIIAGLAQEAAANSRNPFQGFREFFRTPGNRHRLAIVLFGAWCGESSGSNIVTYYMSPVLMSVGIVSVFDLTLVIAMQQLFAWLTATLFALVLTDRLGRRTLFLASYAAMLFCLVAVTAGSAVYEGDPTNKGAAYTAITFFFLFFPAYSLGFSGNLGLYVSEILTFHLRVKGIAIFAAFQLIFDVVNLFVIAIGVTAIAWHLYLIFIGVVVAELVIAYFILPETRGPSLEGVARIFDGPSACTATAEGVDNNGTGIAK